MVLPDTYKHKGLRKNLVKTLKEKGISDENVLSAIDKLPRHWFLDPAFEAHAYEDKPWQIGEGQTISQPYTVAYQTTLLELKPGMKVLEIGTGSGYQTAILIELGAKVFSIERQKKLFERTKNFLPQIGYNPKLFYGDGYKGLPSFAPFDRILVTAGAPFIPEELIKQLAVNGQLVIPVGAGHLQVMTKIIKEPNGELEKYTYDTFSFVPLLEDKV